MKIAIATDHSGFEILKQLKTFLSSLGHEIIDCGPTLLDLNDDYPDYMFKVAKEVASGNCDKGIILGGSGQGEAMAANRIKGVRCAIFYGSVMSKKAVDVEGHKSDDPYEIIKLSRQHNDANMLSLSARFLSLSEIKSASEIWLNTPFSNQERHLRRIQKLDLSDNY